MEKTSWYTHHLIWVTCQAPYWSMIILQNQRIQKNMVHEKGSTEANIIQPSKKSRKKIRN
jgi:hypothetical protein